MKHSDFPLGRYFVFLFLSSGLFFACRNDPAVQNIHGDGQTDLAIQIEQRSFNKKSAHCLKDSVHCMRINATYPFVTSGPDDAVRTINDSILYHLKTNVGVFAVDHSELSGSLDSIATAYIQDFESLMDDSPDYPFAWEIEVEGSVLYQSAKILSVALNAYSFTGGAHPNVFLDLINFDLANGKKLSFSDLFSDEQRLKMLVEKKFREVREIDPNTSITEAGFFWGDPFALPQNFALLEDGVYFHYNPYEAAAYALGVTEFTIPYKELKEVMKGP